MRSEPDAAERRDASERLMGTIKHQCDSLSREHAERVRVEAAESDRIRKRTELLAQPRYANLAAVERYGGAQALNIAIQINPVVREQHQAFTTELAASDEPPDAA